MWCAESGASGWPWHCREVAAAEEAPRPFPPCGLLRPGVPSTLNVPWYTSLPLHCMSGERSDTGACSKRRPCLVVPSTRTPLTHLRAALLLGINRLGVATDDGATATAAPTVAAVYFVRVARRHRSQGVRSGDASSCGKEAHTREQQTSVVHRRC
jgi:hypothetical protein